MRKLIHMLLAAALLPIVVSACASASGGQVAEGKRVGRYGVTVVVPDGWHRVPVQGMPGAKIPVEVASFRPASAVRSICQPGPVVGEIPPGGALVQILDDRGFAGARKHLAGAVSSGPLSAYPPLARPFKLGQLQGHECGEGFNVFFRSAGRAMQLRVWTPPAGPSEAVRAQIEAMVESLSARPVAQMSGDGRRG